jgi:hypothetical protein
MIVNFGRMGGPVSHDPLESRELNIANVILGLSSLARSKSVWKEKFHAKTQKRKGAQSETEAQMLAI